MYDNLVERLRYAASYDERIVIETCKEAADEIEELKTDLDLYKEIAAENQRVARKVIDNYPKWIPVTERLPESIHEYVLCCGEKGGQFVGWTGRLRIENGKAWAFYGGKGRRFTHWMPLPEPPEKESKP